MRAIIVIILCAISLIGMAQKSITIQGRLSKVKAPTKVYLQSADTSGLIFKAVDSTLIVKGKFSFILKNNIVPVVLLTVGNSSITSPPADDSDQLRVYLIFSDSIILITSNTNSIKDALVIGSKTNRDYSAYNIELKPFEKESGALLAKFKARGPDAAQDTLFMNGLIRERDIQNKRYLDLALGFIRMNPNSYFALELLQSSFLQRLINANIAESELNKFSAEIKATHLWKQFSEAIKISKTEARGDGPR